MRTSSFKIPFIMMLSLCFTTSCNRPEEKKIEEVKKEEIAETNFSKHEGLAESMKKASLVMRRLAKSVSLYVPRL